MGEGWGVLKVVFETDDTCASSISLPLEHSTAGPSLSVYGQFDRNLDDDMSLRHVVVIQQCREDKLWPWTGQRSYSQKVVREEKTLV